MLPKCESSSAACDALSQFSIGTAPGMIEISYPKCFVEVGATCHKLPWRVESLWCTRDGADRARLQARSLGTIGKILFGEFVFLFEIRRAVFCDVVM